MMSCTIFNMFLLTATISAEFYSSLASLKAIFEAERNISVIINGYVEKELERLDYLKK